MCLILLAHSVSPNFPLILLANRDEDHARPTAPAHFWPDEKEVLAGRDLVANGTWLGINKTGRWAAVSNLRCFTSHITDQKSRGHLVKDFLTTMSPVGSFVTQQRNNGYQYNGYNLLLGQIDLSRPEVVYLTNAKSQAVNLPPGIYGLSNHTLGTDESRVIKGKCQLKSMLKKEHIEEKQLLDIMKQLDDDTESSIFVANSDYGTRSTTLILVKRDGSTLLMERTYYSTNGATPDKDSDVTFQFRIRPR